MKLHSGHAPIPPLEPDAEPGQPPALGRSGRAIPPLEPDAEPDIDRILTALAGTQPPAHLESRILAALARRTPSAAPLPHRIAPRSSPARIAAWALGLSAATVLLAAAFLSTYNSPGPSHNSLGPSPTSGGPSPTSGGPSFRASAKGWGIAPRATTLPRSASNSATLSATALSHSATNSVILSGAAHSVGSAVEGPRSSPPHRSLPTLSHPESQNPTQARTRPRTILCDCDPTAVAEANAPSLPAPPLPLTAQEKLLLRIAHHPDPVELAELDPRQREAAIAQEQVDYKRFFFHPPAPPPPDATPESEAAQPPQTAPQPQQQNPTDTPTGDQP